jgi:glycine/D-amino acid oxidase-like deaminating enzyme
MDQVPDPPPLPASADVIVIGGGIIGIATALALAERGVAVVLCEKGEIGGEQSSRNWGWIRTIGRDPAEIPLSLASHRMWRDFASQTEFGFRETGIASLCATPREMDQQADWLRKAAPYQVNARLLDGDAVDAIVPGAARRWAGVLHAPGDGVAEPGQATRMLAERAAGAGAILRPRCAARGLDIAGGRVAGVVTEHGRIAANSVVLAGGAWSRLFCGNAGIELPQLKVLGSVCRTAPIAGLPEITVSSRGFSFRKRLDGGYTIAQRGTSVTDIVPDSFRLLLEFLPAFRRQRRELRLRLGRRFVEEARTPRHFSLDAPSPFERVRTLDPAPVPDILRMAARNLISDFPGFAPMTVTHSWAGMIDATPDALPVISPVHPVPGFFLATGFSAHGFGIAPAAGRLVADLVMQRPPIVDPTAFSFSRFDRSPSISAKRPISAKRLISAKRVS